MLTAALPVLTAALIVAISVIAAGLPLGIWTRPLFRRRNGAQR